MYAQNIDCGYSLEPLRRGGSNEYPQSMFFFSRKKKNNVYPCKLQFYYIKLGFKGGWGGGSKLYRLVFVMQVKKKKKRKKEKQNNQLPLSQQGDYNARQDPLK